MTAAYRLRGLGWFLSGVIVVLGFYLVSLQVATERKKVDDINDRIAKAEIEIRQLETEIDARANFAQLQRWNGDIFGLTVPASTQYLPDEAALASIDARNPDAQPASGLQVATYVVPAGLPSLPQGAPVAAAGPAPAPSANAAPEAAPAPVAAPPGRTVLASVAAVSPHLPATTVKPVRTQALAMLDRKLLSDRVIGELVARASAEARGQ